MAKREELEREDWVRIIWPSDSEDFGKLARVIDFPNNDFVTVRVKRGDVTVRIEHVALQVFK